MIKITIQGISEQEFIEILGVDMLPTMGAKVDLPCGVKVVNATSNSQKFSESSVFNFLVSTISDVGIGLLGAYIYDALKARTEKIKIKVNDESVKNEETSIKEALLRGMANDHIEQLKEDETHE